MHTVLRWLSLALGAVLLALGALWVGAGVQDHVAAADARAQSEQAVDQLEADRANSLEEKDPATNKAWATITIPTIDLTDEVVLEGVEAKQINVGVGHYEGTEFPWDGTGNVALAGHRTGWGQPFNRLDELSTGDTIEVETAKATYVYSVTGSTVVSPRETWVLNDLAPEVTGASPDTPVLTLTTCEGPDNAQRLIVFAELTDVVATV